MNIGIELVSGKEGITRGQASFGLVHSLINCIHSFTVQGRDCRRPSQLFRLALSILSQTPASLCFLFLPFFPRFSSIPASASADGSMVVQICDIKYVCQPPASFLNPQYWVRMLTSRLLNPISSSCANLAPAAGWTTSCWLSAGSCKSMQ